jgi:hypothetical protein
LRDDFTKSTILDLAKRAAFCCSNPYCRRPTIGASPQNRGAINIGVAAHISAASPNGPRFDDTLAPHQRSDPSNGIWLCQSCAKLIDSDPVYFTTTTLTAWKTRAETASFAALSGVHTALDAALRHVGSFLGQSPPLALEPTIRLASRLTLASRHTADAPKRRQSVGDLVQWGRLLDGVYAPRPVLSSLVTQEYLAWVATTGNIFRERHLPVFWIDGRSGDGKSVLLLQLAESILESQPAALIYQVSHPDDLPVVVDHIHSAHAGDGLLLVVVDDFHRLTNIDSFNDSIRLTLDREDFHVAVLTCGPAPERTAILTSLAVIDSSSWAVPQLTSDDLSLFSDWFATPVLAAESLDRTILVELLFASHVGAPLPAFARTFGRRLRTFGVFESVCRIVAINALDLGWPDLMFRSATERDSIKRLAQEDQLHFEWKDESWGPGVRLVHRMIAWRLFDELSADHLRAIPPIVRLARVLASVLNMDSVPHGLAFQMVYAIRYRLSALLQLSSNALAHQKDQLFRELVDGTVGNLFACSFVVLAVLEDYLADIDTPINGALISTASSLVSNVNIPPQNRLSIAVLLARLEYYERIEFANHKETAETLAVDPVVGVGATEAVLTLVTHCASAPVLLEQWIRSHANEDAPNWFLCAALNQLGATPIVVSAVRRSVRKHWHDNERPDQLAVLVRVDQQAETLDLAMQWLSDNGDNADTADVITPLLRKNTGNDSVVNVAVKWLERNSAASRSLDVMGQLLNLPITKLRTTLRASVLHLVRQHWDSTDVANTLSTALKVFSGDDELITVATEWLNSHGAHVRAGAIVSALLHAQSGRREIAEFALRWIETRTEPNAGADVLSALLNVNQSIAVRDAALVWIQERLHHVAIFNPISTFLRVAPEHGHIKNVALGWLTQHSDSPGAHSVLSSLIKADLNDIRPRRLALQWVRDNLTNKLAGQLLSTLLRASSGEQEIWEVALQWVTTQEGTLESAQVISTLLLVGKGAPEIQALAKRWIAVGRHRRSAYHQLLAALIGTTADKTEWIEVAVDLLAVEAAQGVESFLVQALAIAAPTDATVIAAVIRYIRNFHNPVAQRQRVLEMWINAGGPDGPAISEVILFRREGRTVEDPELFGIVTRACAREWKSLQAAVVSAGSRGSDLCYLVGRGIPSARLDFGDFLPSLGQWPAADEAFLWQGLLRSRCPSRQFVDHLLSWLGKNWRSKGYRTVLTSVAARTPTDLALRRALPERVIADIIAITS